jgi:hypothetical protein
VEIEIFHENDTVQYIEFKLQEDAQGHPAEYFPEFFHFQDLGLLFMMNNFPPLNTFNRFFRLNIYKMGPGGESVLQLFHIETGKSNLLSLPGRLNPERWERGGTWTGDI